MTHSSTVQLGALAGSEKQVFNHNGTVGAGICVHLTSADVIQAAKSGSKVGISLGKDQSDIGRTAICSRGLMVPLKLTGGFNPVIGTKVYIDDTTGFGKATGGSTTATAGVYRTRQLSALEEDGSDCTVYVAFVDFPGGL
jgi:hypothetical protein